VAAEGRDQWSRLSKERWSPLSNFCFLDDTLQILTLTHPVANDTEPNWGHFSGIGLVIGVGAGLGYFIGHWLDQRHGWHWGAVIGAMLGVASGMYILIKDTIRMNKD
jgi:Putative F0F1-ATPase subunit Ca2+/Mg2+ transporter